MTPDKMTDKMTCYNPIQPTAGLMLRELRIDMSSWTVLLCYLDGAAELEVPPSWPPANPRLSGADLASLTATADFHSCSGGTGRRPVRVAVILNEVERWLTDTAHADGSPSTPAGTPVSELRDAGTELLNTAVVYARALGPPPPSRITPIAVDLLDPAPLERVRDQWRAGSTLWRPFRTRWRPDRPRVLDPTRWQDSLWWQRVSRTDEYPDEPPRPAAPWSHAAAAIAAAVWTWPGAVSDPDGIRQELRGRIDRARAWVDTPPIVGSTE